MAVPVPDSSADLAQSWVPKRRPLAHASLTCLEPTDTLSDTLWRGQARTPADGVRCGRPILNTLRTSTTTIERTEDELENRSGVRATGGSNPSPSANALQSPSASRSRSCSSLPPASVAVPSSPHRRYAKVRRLAVSARTGTCGRLDIGLTASGSSGHGRGGRKRKSQVSSGAIINSRVRRRAA